MDGMITITKKAYIELRFAEVRLNRLHNGGVDNWDWYDDSLNPEGEESLEDIYEAIKCEVMGDKRDI